MNNYQGGLGGSPSLRTLGIHLLLFEEVKRGKKVEVHAIFSDPITGKVKGLFNEHNSVEIYPSHEMENLCRIEYKEQTNGKLPKWNFKENNKKFPKYIQEIYAERIDKQKGK